MRRCSIADTARTLEAPNEVRFERKASYKHSTLSHAIHRCVGTPLV